MSKRRASSLCLGESLHARSRRRHAPVRPDGRGLESRAYHRARRLHRDIGRSGAGKSTLLRLINRLIDPSSGRIVNGTTDVTALRGLALREWRARSAMIFQQFNLVGRLDVLTNVLIGRLAAVPGPRPRAPSPGTASAAPPKRLSLASPPHAARQPSNPVG
jgi:hypothetical protein